MSNWGYYIYLDIEPEYKLLYLFIIGMQFVCVFTPTLLMSRLLGNNLGYKTPALEFFSTLIIGFMVLRFSYTISSSPYPTYLGCLIMGLVIFWFCEGNVINKGFWAVLLPIYLNLSLQISYVILRIIERLDLGIDYLVTVSSQVEFVPILVLTSVSLLAFILLYFLFDKPYQKYAVSSPKHLLTFLGLLVLSLVVNHVAIEYIPDYLRYADDGYFIIILLSNFLSLLVLTYSFYSFKKIESIGFEKLNLSSKLLEQSTKLEYFSEIEASTAMLRKWNHDFVQHIDTLSFLLQNCEYQEALSYVSKLQSTNHRFNFIVNTGYKTIDALISQKIILSEQRGIDFRKKIIFPSNLTVPQTDFCIILSNLLDNAIEACDKTPKDSCKFITLGIEFSDEMLFICVKNSSIGDHIAHDDYFVTTKKKNSFLHGIGCRRVAEITTRYGGIYSFDGDNESFLANIALPMGDDL